MANSLGLINCLRGLKTVYIYIYRERERDRDRERERERVFTFLCKKNMNWMKEKITNFYSKKHEEKKSQNKRKMKRWRNFKVKI